jgi:hypothetical protein
MILRPGNIDDVNTLAAFLAQEEFGNTGSPRASRRPKGKVSSITDSTTAPTAT